MRFLTILLLTFSFYSCGQDDSTQAPTECVLMPIFDSVKQSLQSQNIENYEYVVYKAQMTNDCGKLLQNQSGDFSMHVEALAEKSSGYLAEVNMGGDRIITSSGRTSDARRFTNGSISLSVEYLQSHQQGGMQKWILPWDNIEDSVTVTFGYPKPSDVLLYPRDVSIRLKAGGDTTIETARDTTIENKVRSVPFPV